MEGGGVQEAWAVWRYGGGRKESAGAYDATGLWDFWSGGQCLEARGRT